ncbi:SusC/RagA family TonB-linked outer membrane protein [Dyadobacter sandarakinus]|uniref:SusC/RagA family TonB-linked outer membrane protein n=1 Tax=Dyadobacter sandarakinus TaxID=2747268 RepID=A0ABX7I5E1_9BACT|nr:SusC/RagA family TonB-linked outer membrane protein [Dyadobacter sandarakinus]QRR00423.1 SusC/RagA family TonB-linked outer membrane protein [Dyadobacter sandarakinus]
MKKIYPMRAKLCMPVLWALLGSFPVLAQTVKVSGNVTSASDNAALVGISVVVKGTSNGTTSNAAGEYTLTAPTGGTLVFSFVGFEKQEVPIENRSVINVVLKEDDQQLNEVVVTALGVRREKKQLGYSVSEIDGRKMAATNELSPIGALQGRIPGVQIDQGAGGLMGNTKILIRGNSTLGTNNQPIFVVDGVILDNDVYDGSGRDFGNALKNLNMEDFESVSVLKGSAAAALYGTRAINGVILITTKKGTQRRGIGVSVSQTFNMQKPYRGPDFQNEYGGGTVGAFFTDTREPNYKPDESWTTKVFPTNSQGQPYIDRQLNRELENWGPRFAGQQVVDYDGKMTTYQAYPNNYLDAFQTGKGSLTNVAIDGGNERSTFRFSYNRVHSDGINFKNTMQKNAFNLRATQNLNKFLVADVTADYTTTEGANPPQLNLNNYIWTFPRNYDTKYWMRRENYIGYNGGLRNVSDVNEPNRVPGADYWFNIFENDYLQKEQMVRGRLALTATVTDWLKLQIEGNFNNLYTRNESKELGTGTNFTGGRYGLGHSTKETSFMKWLAIFNRQLTKDIDFSGYFGGEAQKYNLSYNYSETNGGLTYPGNFFLANSVQSQISRGGVRTRRAYKSLYASADFGWRDQVFLQATWRSDWSSALTYSNGSGNNFYSYPSVSLSWVFSQTFHNSLPSWISYGKLRGNIAALGGDIDPFVLNPGFSFSGYTNAGGFGDQPMSTYSSGTTLQQNIKPLRKIAKEIGLELKVLNNRLGIDLSVYRDNSRNQPIPISAAMETGVNSILINAGNIQNTGIEIALDATPVKIGAFSWNTTVNFSRNRNKIVELYGDREYYALADESGGGNDLIPYAKVGGTYGVIRTRIAASRFVSDGSVANDPRNGKAILSWRGDARAAFPARSNEWKDVGDINAKFRGGWDNTFNYKRLSLNVLFDAKIGGDMIITSLRYGTHTGIFTNSLKGRDAGHGGIVWTSKYDNKTYDDGIIPDGVFAAGQTITQADGSSADVGGMTFQDAYDKGLVEPTHLPQFNYRYGSFSTAVGDYWIAENSWISLRQVSLGFQVPQSVCEKIKLNTLSVNLVGRDLFYLYNTLPLHFNPASNYSNSTAVQKEIGFIPPMTRTLGVTLRAGF